MKKRGSPDSSSPEVGISELVGVVLNAPTKVRDNLFNSLYIQ